jgi:CTP synthase
VSVIEFARNVMGWSEATSEEFEEDKDAKFTPEEKKKRHSVVFMPEISKTIMGGTMRLGARGTHVKVSNGEGEGREVDSTERG